MENITADQITKFLEHQQSVRRASAKYYAKKNRKDYTDPKTGQLYEFSKNEYSKVDNEELQNTKKKRKEYHAKRYKEKAEYIKKQTKEYRLKKKQEKQNSNQPLLLSEPVSV
tara:strand:- start:137 stop:472 length:336 start_codon:yes stop_codon:yes gene_type:complete